MKAVWNDVVLADSEEAVLVEGSYYFPPESVRRELLQPTESTSVCPWKGTAHYFNVVVDGRENSEAAWSYSEPKEKAAYLKNYIAFWRGVETRP